MPVPRPPAGATRRRPRGRRAASALPLLLPLLPLLGTAPAPAADGPGWSAAPEPGAAGGTPRPAFYLAGAPGAVLEDRLALTNASDLPRTFALRGAEEPGGAGGAGAWISFGGAAAVTVPPRTRAAVPFTVTVPPAALPGDRRAAVLAAEAGREEAVRVHLRVGGPTLAALTVEDVAVRGRGARTEVAYTLVNRGNVPLAPRVSVRAEGLFGPLPGRPERALPVQVPPGGRLRLAEPWPSAPRLGAADLTLTATAPGAAPAAATASARFAPGVAVPGPGALLALGAAAAAAAAFARRRRARRGPPAAVPGGGAGPEPAPEPAGARA
ncbi:hypothetical protein C0216_27225 [Streptomyces globosus]|uniref:DUF916 domain-containing protein n=1 Tax=Streptomyces globosus TaxID=68209 RepID=A0A344U6X3_9ACTN|nr:hypothetical protein [Streptomyces globosus]AXE26644.1 hypothetical protein C0216_27225 [Streptomyces globosus]